MVADAAISCRVRQVFEQLSPLGQVDLVARRQVVGVLLVEGHVKLLGRCAGGLDRVDEATPALRVEWKVGADHGK